MDAPGGARKRKRSDGLVLEHLACSVCWEQANEPVQCRSGHLLCLACLNSLANPICPQCRVSLDKANPIRCLVASQVQCSMKIAVCGGEQLGCSWFGPLAEKEEHEHTCVANWALRRISQLESTMERMGAELATRQSQPQPRLAVVVSAWRACISDYLAHPLAGAEILAKRTLEDFGKATEHLEWELWCVVPGAGFLRGVNFDAGARFDPISQRVSRLRVRMLLSGETGDATEYTLRERDPPVCGAGRLAWAKEAQPAFSLREVLLTLQQAAIAKPHILPQGATGAEASQIWQDYQKRQRCRASDAAPELEHARRYLISEEGYETLTALKDTLSQMGPEPTYAGAYPMWHTHEQGRYLQVDDHAYCSNDQLTFSPSKVVRVHNLAYRVSADELRAWLVAQGVTPANVVPPASNPLRDSSRPTLSGTAFHWP